MPETTTVEIFIGNDETELTIPKQDSTTVEISLGGDETQLDITSLVNGDTTIVNLDNQDRTEVIATGNIGLPGPPGTSGSEGPQGPPGPPGPPGAGSDGSSYVHNQGTPTATWDIQHNLGFYPNITVIDSAGSRIECDVHYVDINGVVLLFSSGFAGQAFLS